MMKRAIKSKQWRNRLLVGVIGRREEREGESRDVGEGEEKRCLWKLWECEGRWWLWASVFKKELPGHMRKGSAGREETRFGRVCNRAGRQVIGPWQPNEIFPRAVHY